MGRKKIEKINFNDAIEGFEQEKNISREYIIECLTGSIKKAYIKTFLKLGDDAIVRVIINEDGTFNIFEGKTVVEEVTDDYIEIDAKEQTVIDAGLKVGDVFETEVDQEKLTHDQDYIRFIKSIMTGFMTRIRDAEKAALLEIYKDKIGELITGTIDQITNKETNDYMINIGKTIVPLGNRDLIGRERFKQGDEVKVYVVDVQDTPKGPQIHVSRSDAGFLRRLFELNIHEIYDGTIIIKNIAREAGERSKIAVYSKDPNVDPCGACIGMNGQRIQVITQSLGNNVREKEKIDVVLFDEDLALYVKEALVPAQVIGVALDVETMCCTAIVKNGDLSLAIGRGGINVRLAGKLVGIKIDIKEQDDALKNHIEYKTIEEIKLARGISKKVQEETVDLPFTEEEEAILDETDEIGEAIDAHNESIEEENIENTTAAEEVSPTPVVEEEKVEVEVKTSYEDLLKSLEAEKKEQKAAPEQKKWERKPYTKKPVAVEVKKEEDKKEIKGMAIYTEEELKALEDENVNETDDNQDYSEYDDDGFYEEI